MAKESSKLRQEILPQDPSNDELMEYSKAVENLAKEKSTVAFDNEDSRHAAIVMKNIFKYSNSVVNIFTNELNGPVSDEPEYVNGLKAFLDKPRTKLNVLYENGNEDILSKGFGLVLELQKDSKYTNRIKIKKIGDDFLAKIGGVLKSRRYFAIGDDKSFRIASEANPEIYEAIACFNNSSIVSKIKPVFISEIQ